MKVLLPVDGSDCSHRAVRYLVKHWAVDTTVTLLNVDSPLRESIAGHLDAESVARFHRDNATACVRTARRILAKAGHLFEERLVVGEPAVEIMRMAKVGRYELIVMGSHGRGVLGSLFLGSVVLKVLAGSRIPVLVVR